MVRLYNVDLSLLNSKELFVDRLVLGDKKLGGFGVVVYILTTSGQRLHLAIPPL